MAPDAFGSNARRGENAELREELLSTSVSRKKDALKRTIAAMTVGKDVSGLFPDVVNCIQTKDLELKKLVYLYLINYAHSNPDLALLAVNTFVKDAADYSPMVRALAIRTMACIQVDRIITYLCDPLRKAVRDEDPYVRKTVAIAIAKLYEISPSLAEEEGFLDHLEKMIDDPHPMVLANVIKAMESIDERKPGYYRLPREIPRKILGALSECNEWCQVYLLEALARSKYDTPSEADEVVEGVSPRLQHANPAVVLAAVRVIINVLPHFNSDQLVERLYRKLAAPLVTLMNGDPETQYVTLRCTNLLLNVHPNLISQEVRVFFCKYNDPLYVKLEKLQVIYRLTTPRNANLVLGELKEYTAEIDEEFVRRSVHTMGQIALKLESEAESCVSLLLDFLKTDLGHLVEEAVLALRDVFRKYPERFYGVVEVLCRTANKVELPSARASLIWLLGEHSSQIKDALDIAGSFLTDFQEETLNVQLQILTSVVKISLDKGPAAQDMLRKVLSLCTTETDRPELRVRGFLYMRILKLGDTRAKEIVLGKKPRLSKNEHVLEPPLLHDMVQRLGFVSSVLHRPKSDFAAPPIPRESKDTISEVESSVPPKEQGLLDLTDFHSVSSGKPREAITLGTAETGNSLVFDLLGLPAPTVVPPRTEPLALPSSQTGSSLLEMELYTGNTKTVSKAPFNQVGTSSTATAQGDFFFDNLALGFSSGAQPNVIEPGPLGSKNNDSVTANTLDAIFGPSHPEANTLQGFTGSLGPAVSSIMSTRAELAFSTEGRMDKPGFLQSWASVSDRDEKGRSINLGPYIHLPTVIQKLEAGSIFLVANRAKKDIPGGAILYMSAKLADSNTLFLIELTVLPGNANAQLATRSIPKVADTIHLALCAKMEMLLRM